MYKYIAIIFPPDNSIIEDIMSISNSIINEVEYESTVLVVFESALTKNEANTFLCQNSDNRTFILSDVDSLHINLPEQVIDYLMDSDSNKLESYGTKSIMFFNSEEDKEEFEKTLNDDEKHYYVFHYDSIIDDEEKSAQEYVDGLSDENKAKEYEQIMGKLPNVNKWEAEVLKLLINEQ